MMETNRETGSGNAPAPTGATPPPIKPVPVAKDPPDQSKLVTYGCAGIVILIVAAVLIPIGLKIYRSAQQEKYKHRMQQIVVAINQYRDQYGCFPPAYTVDAEGKRLHSWRTLILPQLGQAELYKQIHLNEPWDSPQNKQFHAQRPAVYGHTMVRDTIPYEAHALAVVGRDTVWPEHYSARIKDLGRGVSNTALLVEYSGSDVNWMEPRDLTRKELRTDVFRPGSTVATGAFDGVFLGFADEHVRMVSPRVNRQLVTAFFGRGWENTPLAGVDWAPDPGPVLPPLPEARPATAYPLSQVIPHLSGAVDVSKNLIYCATFQIVWDELRDRAQGPVQFGTNSDLASALNSELFPKSDLRPESYLAMGGSGPEVVPKISAELKKRFQRGNHLAQGHDNSELVIYCYLIKQLPFSVDFERFGVPLEFHSGEHIAKVEGFGIDSLQDVGNRLVEILGQVKILDHVSDDDFILKLKTRERQDEIFMAKIKPEATLRATLQAVLQRIDAPAKNGFRTQLGGGDKLFIPVLQLSIDRHFDELIGLNFRNPSLSGLHIAAAQQVIKFRLDETGSIVESEAIVLGENGDSHVATPYDANKPRQLVFDRPFLLFVRETQAKAPYLVMWIANEELMEPSRK